MDSLFALQARSPSQLLVPIGSPLLSRQASVPLHELSPIVAAVLLVQASVPVHDAAWAVCVSNRTPSAPTIVTNQR
jgi:hypothetical protein